MLIDKPSTLTHIDSTAIHPPVRKDAARDGAATLGLLRQDDQILFIGDSITDAYRRPEEKNNAFRLGGGYVLMIGAQLLSGRPDFGFRFTNQGISGQRISQIAERWQRDCLDLAPDVVSVLVGVNSTIGKFHHPQPPPDADISAFSQIYEAMINQLDEALPDSRLVLGEPFLLPCGFGQPELMEDVRARGAAVRELAAERDACFVPFQAMFDHALKRAPAEYWAYDGVHPTAAGMWLMAQTWLKHVVG